MVSGEEREESSVEYMVSKIKNSQQVPTGKVENELENGSGKLGTILLTATVDENKG